MRFFRLKHVGWILPLALILLFAAYLASNFFTNNFHTVIPQKLYRSAQLKPLTLLYYVKKYQIRTVVNLRGPHPGKKWYVGELLVSRSQNLHHYNVTLPAHGLPTRASLKRLVAILQKAPKPLLVHCRQGADRTGIASAIGVILSSDSREYSVKQMSWRYNVLSPHTIGYEVMNNYFAWLKTHKQKFGRKSFLKWLNSDASLKPYHGIFLS